MQIKFKKCYPVTSLNCGIGGIMFIEVLLTTNYFLKVMPLRMGNLRFSMFD